MFECARLSKIEDYFKNYSNRATNGVYFYRLIDCNSEIKSFINKYLEETKKCGVFINGKIHNPDEGQLLFFEEIIGLDFKLDKKFFDKVLKKWLPRLDEYQRKSVLDSMYNILYEMIQDGNNENILKNTYIKFMCWMYYKFERILNQLGKENLPKILYEGYVSKYELKMLYILARTGCDILLLQYRGDEEYLKVDSASKYSMVIPNNKPEKFPAEFSISSMQKRVEKANSIPKINIEQPDGIVNTNTWLMGDIFLDSLKQPETRGVNSSFYYNMFIRIKGVEDKATYLNELLHWKMKLESLQRYVLIIEKIIQIPSIDEIQKVNRKNYQSMEQLILDLSTNIKFEKNKELEKLAKKTFIELLEEEKGKDNSNLNRLSNRAVCLICLINRFIPQLFKDWKQKSSPTFVYYGVCNNDNEVILMRFLSRMPIDVFIICPDLSMNCKLIDKFLFEKKYDNSLSCGKFPAQIDNVQFGTVAYHAEQDLNTILYQDTGVYRNRQFKKAIPVQLQTMYEEISILWNQESKYRPNFEILDDRVMVPVILSKVSGVPNGNKEVYWSNISKLIIEDTFVVRKLPFITINDNNPIKQHVTNFIKNGKLQIQKIKSHPSYQYSFIREDMQDYIFDKLQQLIDKKIINGTFSQGVEFTILSTALNLDKEILRMIHKYDFAKTIPKLIIISTGEEVCSLEDSIMVAFLSMLGFDIVIFTPTGYQSVERNYSEPIINEHQVGDYIYDLQVPKLKNVSSSTHKEGFIDKLFRRGR